LNTSFGGFNAMPGSAARAGLTVVPMDTAMNATNIIIYIKKIGARSIYRNRGGIEVPKSMIKRIITAGPLVMEAVYPASSVRDGPAVRQGKKNLSSQAQQLMNFKYAYQKLEFLIAANFGEKDLYVTLTYDDSHLPENRQEALKKMKAFLKRLRKVRKEGGYELRYIYVTEHKHRHDNYYMDGRWHHHILINATGDDFDLIRRLWGQGNMEFRRMRVDKEKHFESLARYFCKEQRDKLGLRLWSGSRNLRKPERECFRVPDNTQLKMPAESRCIRLMDTGNIKTDYGRYRYIKYIAKAGLSACRPRAKRRRRKK